MSDKKREYRIRRYVRASGRIVFTAEYKWWLFWFDCYPFTYTKMEDAISAIEQFSAEKPNTSRNVAYFRK